MNISHIPICPGRSTQSTLDKHLRTQMNEYEPGHVSHVGSNSGEELVPGEAKKISVTILLFMIKVAEDDTTLRCLTLHLTSPLEGATWPPFT